MTIQSYPAPGELTGRREQMFPRLSAAQVTRVAASAKEESFEAGAPVCEQDDASVPLYVVLDGQLDVLHPYGAAAHPVTVHDPGEFTGEMSLLLGRHSLVRARAPNSVKRVASAVGEGSVCIQLVHRVLAE